MSADDGRPSTDTPVRVAHEFILHVFFSVEGQDNHGKPLPSPFEPGEIRAMTVSIPIEIPSVGTASSQLCVVADEHHS